MPEPFIDRQDLSDVLGRDVTAHPGALIYVDAACDMVRDISGQQINRGTSTISLDGTGTDALLLPQRPVNSAGTVSVAGTIVTDYVVDTERGMLFRKHTSDDIDWWGDWDRLPTIKWPAGRQNITITYDHGWADEDIPRSVRGVALAVAKRMTIQGGALRETVGDNSVQYAIADTDLTTTEKLILDKLRH